MRDIKVMSPGEAPQERKEVAHGASRGRIAKSTKPRLGRKNVLPPPPGATPVAPQSHGLRRGLLYFALTDWRNALSTGYAWILAIRFGIGESATFRRRRYIAGTVATMHNAVRK